MRRFKAGAALSGMRETPVLFRLGAAALLMMAVCSFETEQISLIPSAKAQELTRAAPSNDAIESDRDHSSQQGQCCVSGPRNVAVLNPPQGPAPFDLVWDTTDPNGLPSNPRWGYWSNPATNPNDPNSPAPDPAQLCPWFTSWFSPGPIPASCATQRIWRMTEGLACDGHVNWTTVEYDGPLYWDVNDGHSNPLADDDYNFLMGVHIPTRATFTKASPSAIQLEFAAYETIDHFHSAWWERFHSLVDDNSATVINTDYAIVIGLFGLDCEHSCTPEIHPVFAMAIHDSSRRGPDDDVWAFFVRNEGGEGFCSPAPRSAGIVVDSHLTSVSFRIPNTFHASRVTMKPTVNPTSDNCRDQAGSTQMCTNSTEANWAWGTLPNNDVLVSFNIPLGAQMNGEAHLQWSGPGLGDPCASLRARVLALQNELDQLYSGVSSNKAGIGGVEAAAERRIAAWHSAHDAELNQLRQQLATCESRAGLPSAVAIRAPQSQQELTPELRLQEAFSKLPLDRRQSALRQIDQLMSTNVSEDSKPAQFRGQAALLLPGREITHEPVAAAVAQNPALDEQADRRRQILCSAFSNDISGLPGACK
jgi:hypothetical protein